MSNNDKFCSHFIIFNSQHPRGDWLSTGAYMSRDTIVVGRLMEDNGDGTFLRWGSWGYIAPLNGVVRCIVRAPLPPTLYTVCTCQHRHEANGFSRSGQPKGYVREREPAYPAARSWPRALSVLRRGGRATKTTPWSGGAPGPPLSGDQAQSQPHYGKRSGPGCHQHRNKK